jgi:hypothetical protein
MDAYHTGKRPMNSGCVSYREEASEFWIGIIQGTCMIRIHNSLASSLYDTYPEFIGLFPV